MGGPGNPKAIQLVKEMIRDEAAGYYMLQLPNGKWAALWSQGLEGEWVDGIAIGDYSGSCAHIGEAFTVADYIEKEYQAQLARDPMNPPRPIKSNGLISQLLRSYSDRVTN